MSRRSQVRADLERAGSFVGRRRAFWFLAVALNSISDPIIGYLSDHTRSRMGRRRPWVLLGAPMLAMAFFFLWTPPGQSPWALAAYFFMILFIFDTIYSLTIIAYNALFPEVAPTVRDRVDLSTVREIRAIPAGW